MEARLHHGGRCAAPRTAGGCRAVGAPYMNAQALGLNGQAILYSPPGTGKTRESPMHAHVCAGKTYGTAVLSPLRANGHSEEAVRHWYPVAGPRDGRPLAPRP